MKKTLVVGVTAALVLSLAGAALAFMGPGMGMGFGARGAAGGPGGPGHGPCWQAASTGTQPQAAVTQEKANEIAQDYVTKNLPGFTVEKIEPFARPMGTMYLITLKGPKDEVRTIHINPWGLVMPFGPRGAFGPMGMRTF